MATPTLRRPQNIDGQFYVDSTCIDCDTCRWMAPETFHEAGGKSAVHHQPTGPEQRMRALQALVACPTASIGTQPPAPDVAQAAQSFPLPITSDVSHCGFHAESSFGAASYFIRRPGGNVLLDSPRFADKLVRRLEELGGIRWMLLTHRDDVADHREFAKHFGCDRVIHADDVTQSTRSVEIQLEGPDEHPLAPDLLVIPVPGHTKGHAVLLHDRTHLFTGDHLAWSETRGHLIAFRRACWYSWPKQIESMQRLTAHDFEWVLPAHGRRIHLESSKMSRSLRACIRWMQSS